MKTIEPLNLSDFTSPANNEPAEVGDSANAITPVIDAMPDPLDFVPGQRVTTSPTFTSPTTLEPPKSKTNRAAIFLNVMACLLIVSSAISVIANLSSTIALVVYAFGALLGIGLILRWGMARRLVIVLEGISLWLDMMQLASVVEHPSQLIPWFVGLVITISMIVVLLMPSIKEQFGS